MVLILFVLVVLGAASNPCPHLEFTVDDTHGDEKLNVDVQTLVLRPEVTSLLYSSTGKAPNTICERLTIATTNKAFKCFSDEAAVLVRVYGSSILGNRSEELQFIQMASHHKIGPRLHLTFNNGYMMEFLNGFALEPEHLRQPFYYTRIAATFAKWHSLKLEQDQVLQRVPVVQHNLIKWLSLADNLAGEDPQLPVLKSEIEEILRALSQYDENYVTTHNDLNHGNIIYDPKTDTTTFVDYECAGSSWRGFDLANHFCEWGGLDLDFSQYPSKEEQYEFFTAYFVALGSQATSSALDAIYAEVNKFSLLSHLVWTVWMKVQAKISDITYFNYTRYAVTRMDQYWATKQTFLNLQPYPTSVPPHENLGSKNTDAKHDEL